MRTLKKIFPNNKGGIVGNWYTLFRYSGGVLYSTVDYEVFAICQHLVAKR